jgi:WD40 repeat protein
VTVGQAVFALHHLQRAGLLLVGTEGGDLHVIDLRSASERQLLRVHRRGLYAFADLPGGRVVAAGGDGSLSIWSFSPEGRLDLHRQLPLGEDKLRGLATSPHGDMLAVASGSGQVHVLDTTDLNEPWTLEGHEGGSLTAAWHPSKPVMLTGGKDGHLRFWHAGDGFRALQAAPVHKGAVYAIAFAPDAQHCATAGRDKMAKLWDALSFDPVARLDRTAGGHTHSVNCLRWEGRTLLTAGDDKTIRAWTVG